MSNVLVEPSNDSRETGRKATLHTAVLLPASREHTGLSSGRVDAKRALQRSTFQISMPNTTCRSDMQLANEMPFYEVAFRGKVFRLLSRPVEGLDSSWRPDHEKYALVCTLAPGLQCDGWFMDPPTAVPNTPRSLVEDFQQHSGASLVDILSEAYSIFHYRLDHVGRYPDSMEPAGYRFRELFLMSVGAAGELSTLYETPKGNSPELWTLFLRTLDEKNPKLGAYVNSSMAVTDFGAGGVAAMREALLLRNVHSSALAPTSYMRFLETFPPHTTKKLQRDVGTNASWLWP
jgi:hypothetical protein